ncbi:Predicted acetyltransferase, GNAT superfamily [Paenibacillus sp. UNCCL117]|uniref:GNAT family N-acetyltransferase n=1 Tax=unclassified Paenibacillus TaxID=185978 RepID=UPI000881CCBD|nr:MULTISPECIES: GNAT family N-acetyltransferase [unclassified Paenibacillus]SDD50930.1 Predicted acetyltransferase, GNAT superfamily [Paenibacillus sp. cl123]SFW49631.1 Predicted acetyltransferase, GNAT superfamily [Paenibacillus sp. UNCCL117]
MAYDHGDSIQYRLTTKVSELREAVELQKLVWGPDAVSSMQHMRAAILHGGSVIGAFCEGALVGFCYGFPGYDGKEAYVGSHMMAIHPAYRDRGIGMRLKLEQRLWAMQAGYGKIVWTFDPFESRNAYLNICKLGGVVSTYIPEFYGLDAAGFPTDRFLVEWVLSSDRVACAVSGERRPMDNASDYPRLLTVAYSDDGLPGVKNGTYGGLIGKSHGLRLPIPRAASKLKQAQPDVYRDWQRQVRERAAAVFADGYQVVSCHQSEPEVQDYVLERKV